MPAFRYRLCPIGVFRYMQRLPEFFFFHTIIERDFKRYVNVCFILTTKTYMTFFFNFIKLIYVIHKKKKKQ